MIVQDKRDIVRGKKDESVNVSKMELKARYMIDLSDSCFEGVKIWIEDEISW